jgi:hypothetical protein
MMLSRQDPEFVGFQRERAVSIVELYRKRVIGYDTAFLSLKILGFQERYAKEELALASDE